MASLKPFKILFKSDQDGAINQLQQIKQDNLNKMSEQSLESNINQEKYNIKV
jgi:hypothetical protein